MNIYNNINDFEEVGIEELTNLIKEDNNLKEPLEIINYYKNHFLIEIDNSLNIIKSGYENKADVLKKVFYLLESFEDLIERNNSNIKHVFNILDINEHPLVQSYIHTKTEKYLFIEEIINKIKNWENAGKDILHSLKSFRMSEDGRKFIKNKRSNLKMNEFWNELLKDYSVAQKAEIYTRIEKYIEYGWYKIDNPLKEYLAGNDTKEQAIKKLKESMGKRFFKLRVISNHIGGTIMEDSLVFDEEDKIGDKIFDLAASGCKDFAIKSPDSSKIYIGDITTQESTYNNGDSIIRTGRAAIKYERENPGVKIEISVSLVSAFYDINSSRTLKESFVNKLKLYNQDIVNDWNLMQVLSVLDRTGFTSLYLYEEIFEKVNVNFFGSTSEIKCNEILKDKENFSNKVLDLLERTLDNFGDFVFNSQRMETNADSIALHLFIATFKGIEKVICQDIEKLNRYCSLKDKLFELEQKIINGYGHIASEIFNKRLTLNPELLYNEYSRKIKLEREQYILISNINTKKEKFISENKYLISELLKSVNNLYNIVKSNYEPILYSQSSTWNHNYYDVFERIEIGLSKLEDKNNNYWIYTNNVINKEDNVIKEALCCFSKLINAPLRNKNFSDIERVLIELKEIIEKDYKFQTKNIKNSQNKLTNFGNFVSIYLNANSNNYKDKLENYYFNFRNSFKKEFDNIILINNDILKNIKELNTITNTPVKNKNTL